MSIVIGILFALMITMIMLIIKVIYHVMLIKRMIDILEQEVVKKKGDGLIWRPKE